MTAFADLPDLGQGLRLVGSTVMDSEQFSVEQWTEHDGYWHASLEGLRRYAELRRQRREDRKSAWQSRVDRDEEYSDSITALIEGEKP